MSYEAWTDEEDEVVLDFGREIDGQRVDVAFIVWAIGRSEEEIYSRFVHHLGTVREARDGVWGPPPAPPRPPRLQKPKGRPPMKKGDMYAPERRVQIKLRPGFLGVRRRNLIAVGAGTPFENPFTLDMLHKLGKVDNANVSELVMLYQRWLRGDALLKFEANLTPEAMELWPTLAERREALCRELPRVYRHLDDGGVIGCHCRVEDSCHADVLVALWREHWTPDRTLAEVIEAEAA